MIDNARDASSNGEPLVTSSTVWGLLEVRAGLTPDAPALIDEAGRRLTFKDVRHQTLQTAAHLHSLGIGPGSRVAWKLPTRVSTVMVMMALARLGAMQAPIISAYGDRETATALAAAAAEYVLAPGGGDGRAIGALRPSAVLVPIDAGDVESSGSVKLPSAPDDGDDPRWIYFTSGSSGSPKGCWHCDRSLMRASYDYTVRSGMGAEPNDVGSIVFPIAHVGGMVYFGSMLTAGFPGVLVETFRPAAVVELFNQHRVTMTGGSTAVYSALLAAQRNSGSKSPIIPSLRLLKGGGAPCPPDVYHGIRKHLGGAVVAHDYGMTEVPMIAASGPSDTEDQLAHTEGCPIASVQVRIAGPDGAELAVGTDGDIHVRGAVLFRGYVDPADADGAFTDDGWFRTGDRGHLRDDGHLEVTGRTKDLIIRKGENIAPAELEALLRDHPAVAEVAVLGLPDVLSGERVCAVVVPHRDGRPPTLDEIVSFLREAGIMAQKWPEQLEIVADLPVRGLGKVDKTALRDKFADESRLSKEALCP